ncbi:MAG: hypothetical protein R2912_08925 [Eubacteriales bacterium]
MNIRLDNELPPEPRFEPDAGGARPTGRLCSTRRRRGRRPKNALLHGAQELHETLATEFFNELKTRGRVYAYRYRPEGRITEGRSTNIRKVSCG